jgi:hypothetical protein
MVFGHEGCGIIRTAQQPLDKLESGPEELASWFKVRNRGGSTPALYLSDPLAAKSDSAPPQRVRIHSTSDPSSPPSLPPTPQLVRRGVGLELGSIADISDTHARDREAVIRNVIYQASTPGLCTRTQMTLKPFT